MAKSKLQRTAETPSVLQRLQGTARRLKVETYALYLAYKDPRTPWYARAWVIFVVAHTFSPIDLIPDFIPVLGYLDDIIITPFGIWLALKMIPPEVMSAARENAHQLPGPDSRLGRVGAYIVVFIWVFALAVLVALFFRFWKN